MRSRRLLLSAFATAVCWTWVCSLAQSDAQQPGANVPPKIEDIIKAWEARQAKVKSAHFVWNDEITRTKGSISKTAPPMFRPKGPSPPEDMTYHSPRVVYIDQSKLFYGHRTRDWHEQRGCYVDTEWQFAHNGDVFKVFKPISSNAFPVGLVRKNCIHSEVTTMHIRPVLMTLRPTDSSLAPYREGMFRVTGKRAILDGKNCWEIRVPSTGMLVAYFWVDPTRGFVSPRFSLYFADSNGIAWNVDVQYETHPVAEWIPIRWKLVQNHIDGSLLLSTKSSVVRYEINPILGESTFDIEFPPGTYVTDESTRSHYIQLDESRQRLISNRELSVPYEELLKKASAETSAQKRLYRVVGWLAILLLIVGGVVAYRLRRGRTT
jgi:hypothetical protein